MIIKKTLKTSKITTKKKKEKKNPKLFRMTKIHSKPYNDQNTFFLFFYFF